MKFNIFFCIFFFYCNVFLKLTTGKRDLLVSLKGADDIPIRGLLLGNNKMESDMEMLRKTVENINNRLSAIEKKLKKSKSKEGYIGCFKDDNQRHLKHRYKNLDNSATLAKCKTHCKGYKYLGLQARQLCFCGNDLSNKNYPRVSDSECNVNCKGEPKRMCGASWRNSIYLV